MWWKICKLLVALVLIALLMLIFVNSKQQNTNADVEKKTKLAEEIQNNGRSELIESREMYLPIEDNENTKANAGESIQTTSEPEIDSDRNTKQAFYAGSIRYAKYDEKKVYAALSNDPDEKPKVSKGDRSINLSNSKGETIYLEPGRIAYRYGSSSNQIYELTSYPAQATEKDAKLRQKGIEALKTELRDMNQEEAKRKAEEMIDNLFKSDLYHVEVIDVYGYTKEQLEEQHRILYKERDSWNYFYKELPKEIDNDVYYLKMQMYIEENPICIEDESLGLQYSIYSDVSIVPTKIDLVMSKNKVFYMDISYEFDLSNIEKMDALSEMEMEKRLEEEMEGNLLADNFEMSFRYLYIRHGTGEKATYTLQPAWRVQIDQKNNEETLLFYDAVTGKQLF